MGDTVRHTATATSVLIATFVEVSHDSALGAAALGLGVEADYLTKSVLRVIGEGVLVVKHLIVASHLFKAAE